MLLILAETLIHFCLFGEPKIRAKNGLFHKIQNQMDHFVGRQRSPRRDVRCRSSGTPAKRQAARFLATRLGSGSAQNVFYGIRTASMTWITPLLAAMSVLTTFAPPTVTLPSSTLMASFLPFTVLALVVVTFAAINLPGRTW